VLCLLYCGTIHVKLTQPHALKHPQNSCRTLISKNSSGFFIQPLKTASKRPQNSLKMALKSPKIVSSVFVEIQLSKNGLKTVSKRTQILP
jgi:hypothetical protein